MRHKTLLITAIGLLVLGIAGLAVLALTVPATSSGDPGALASNGQRIYYTGADATGPIPRSVAGGGRMGRGMMGAAACVDCHGEDGRGGRVGMMFGSNDIPDIRYSALTGTHVESGTTVPGWTDADITRAIRDGVEPDGQRLEAPMPQWDMNDTDMKDLIGYLKELDRR